LFEAFIAQGQGKNEAINAVVSELRSRLVVYQNSGYVTTATQTQSYPWNTSGTAYYSPVPNSFVPNTTYTITTASDGMSNVSYTLTNGNKVNYNVNTDSISLYNQATGTGSGYSSNQDPPCASN
jgi:hypothetical protein